MKTFEIDEEALQKGWGAEGQYWFSLENFIIKEHSESADLDRPDDLTEEEFMLSLGYIPYFRVNRVELAKAFIEMIPNNKLRAALAKVDDSDYIETFWKYFKVYPKVFDSLETFQSTYLSERAKAWCYENNINFIIK